MLASLVDKSCSPKESFVSLSPESSPVALRSRKSTQKPGSDKHVLVCITNAPIPFPTPSKQKFPGRISTMPPHKSFKSTRRASDVPFPGSSVPGPFLFLRRVQSGSYGEAIAVCELDGQWLQGAPGRVLCMKVFNKSTSLLRGLIPGIVQEVLSYRMMARAHARADDEGGAFVMSLEASLQDENRLFFVMELMDCDLLAVLNGHRFPRKANARRWICQIALGLSFIHASGVIHRDLKPENLLLDAAGTIRISDFGSAHTEKMWDALDPSKVYAHEVTGTYAYMAPEMLCNRKKSKSQIKMYGLAVDYWSLGCVGFELVSDEGECLFDTEEELQKYQTWPETAAATYLSFAGLSEDAESLLSGLLDLDPLQRFGIAALREHPYFQNDSGVSEFSSPRGPSVCHPGETQHSYGFVPEEPDLVEGHRNLFTVCLDPPEDDETFEHFGWINPKGIWGTV
ncbi:kinase domain-containing protein [Favolaschia claudopus]|uniref:non-specific serine/threonine protein kinase n=1 Tax=Favolaschia claudopus TaxID=2862362 RepID=A0AAW0CU82_9AGAR